ncbi:hypothetical protein XELAEV_18032929mg [Xenopus laevis]|uniref:Uncharacterized protein n=1 Tax=Xenopus laevis TaxID=8355 RepID=A0A974HDH3_XENLA|nr:hypothetical protein XELAEV_18032929mg [Xenopus laevis]
MGASVFNFSIHRTSCCNNILSWLPPLMGNLTTWSTNHLSCLLLCPWVLKCLLTGVTYFILSKSQLSIDLLCFPIRTLICLFVFPTYALPQGQIYHIYNTHSCTCGKIFQINLIPLRGRVKRITLYNDTTSLTC